MTASRSKLTASIRSQRDLRIGRVEDEIRAEPAKMDEAVRRRADAVYAGRLQKEIYSALPPPPHALICVGPGGPFHPDWETVDRLYDDRRTWRETREGERGALPDIVWNALDDDPLPKPDASASAIYCAHMIEHLPEAEAARFLAECRRVLAPGGALRLTTPDLGLAVGAYEREDWSFFLEHHAIYNLDAPASLFSSALTDPDERRAFAAWRLIASFSMLLDDTAEEGDRLVPEACADFIERRADVETAVLEAARLGATEGGRAWGGHMSCWSWPRLENALRDAGFAEVELSGYLRSRMPQMRDRRYFDRTDPHNSLYVEAFA